MNKPNETQVDRLRTIFAESGLSNVEIAEKLSCSPAYVSKLKLQNDVRPRTTFLSAAAHAFNISETWLLDGNGPMKISIDVKLKIFLESLATSTDSNDVYIRKLLQNYLTLTTEEQSALVNSLSQLFCK